MEIANAKWSNFPHQFIDLQRDCREQLGQYKISVGRDLRVWGIAWDIIPPRVRQALVGLSLLSDECCSIDAVDFGKRMALEYTYLCRSQIDKPLVLEAGLRERKRLEKNRRARCQRHLLRPGGLVAPDIAQLAGVSEKRRVRGILAKLKEIGAIKQRVLPGRQPRYFPVSPSWDGRSVIYRQTCIGDFRELGALLRRVAPYRPLAGSRNQWETHRSTDGEIEEKYFLEKNENGDWQWARLGEDYGAYIVGESPTPDTARLLCETMRRVLPKLKRPGYEMSLSKDADSLFLIVRLQ
jgi:hypothetical protein